MITSVLVTRVSFWSSLVQPTLFSSAYKQKDLVYPEQAIMTWLVRPIKSQYFKLLQDDGKQFF